MWSWVWVWVWAAAVPLHCASVDSLSSNYFSRYANASVWRFTPVDDAEAAAITMTAESLHLDVWRSSRVPAPAVDVLIPAHTPLSAFLSGVSNLLPSSPSSLVPDLFVADVAAAMQAQMAASLLPTAFDPGVTWFLSYHPYADIVQYMENLASEYPDLVTLISIGQTVNGNAIQGVKITRGSQKGKQALFFTGCIHAREWISAATMQYLMNWLVTVPQYVDEYEWIIVPVTNVDGYQYTWTNDRMWRKNRRKQKTCYGVDVNRNFAYQWGSGGSSSIECSDTYKGPLPASEPETQAVQSILSTVDNLIVYADVHAYGQLWMTPWGWTSALPPSQDYDAQIETSKLITDAIYNTHNRQYTYGPVATTIYPASGCSSDFSYGTRDVVLSYAVELRGTSNSQAGFLLPPEEIIPQGEEFVQGVTALMEWISENGTS